MFSAENSVDLSEYESLRGRSENKCGLHSERRASVYASVVNWFRSSRQSTTVAGITASLLEDSYTLVCTYVSTVYRKRNFCPTPGTDFVLMAVLTP